MQRQDTDGGIIISCDFCGTDWDPQTGLPVMTEGHRGSVMCLSCLQKALPEAQPAEAEFDCTLCLQHREAGVRRWPPEHAGMGTSVPMSEEAAKARAAACWSCIRLAAKTFHKDKDIDFRWNPADWPRET